MKEFNYKKFLHFSSSFIFPCGSYVDVIIEKPHKVKGLENERPVSGSESKLLTGGVKLVYFKFRLLLLISFSRPRHESRRIYM